MEGAEGSGEGPAPGGAEAVEAGGGLCLGVLGGGKGVGVVLEVGGVGRKVGTKIELRLVELVDGRLASFEILAAIEDLLFA